MNKLAMNKLGRFTAVALLVLLLSACPNPTPPATDLTEDQAWTGTMPEDAEVVSEAEFRRLLAAGDITLVTSAELLAQAEERETQFDADKAELEAAEQAADLGPALEALLEEAAAEADYEGERALEGPDGETVVLFGLGTQLRNAAEVQERAESAENALEDYSLSYVLLSDALKAQLPTPESLAGKSLEEVQAALAALNALLTSEPELLGLARLEANGAAAQISPGNGSDASGVCNPTGLFRRYWFPLKNFVSPVKNQASRGTCWAFTAIGALESRERVQNNNPVNLSEQFLVNKVKEDWDESDYTDGYWSERALGAAADRGQQLPSEAAWTYNGATGRPNVTDGSEASYANSCNGYNGTCSNTAHQSRRVCTTVVFTFCGYRSVSFGGPGVAPSRAVQIWASGQGFDLNRYRFLLAQGHTLMASFPVYKGFMDDVGADGVVSNYAMTRLDAMGNEVAGSYGGHAVQIIGFLSNQDMSTPSFTPNVGGGGYFIVKNSWGCAAGDGGYYYVPADYVSRLFTSLSVLAFDARRSDAWTREQATPGGSDAPSVTLRVTPPARADLRVPVNLAGFFRVAHPVARSVALTVTGSTSGTIYSGAWNIDPNSFGQDLYHTFGAAGRQTITVTARYGDRTGAISFALDVINSPPTLTLNYAGDAYAGEPYAITAQVLDRNESSASGLCANTTWSVDAPDILSSTTGCQVQVTFAGASDRPVRVTTRDSEGLTASLTRTIRVLPPPVNPYPRVTAAGMYSREYRRISNTFFCSTVGVAPGATIDFREESCTLLVTQPPGPRYVAELTVENPDGEALSYDWRVFVTVNGVEQPLNSPPTSSEPFFEPYSVGNAIDVTNDCRVAVTVNAPEASRSKSLTVWSGRCTYWSTRLN